MKIFLVQGSTGVYEESRNWIVKGFITEEAAKEYSKRCLADIQAKEEEERKLDDTISLTTATGSELCQYRAKCNAIWIGGTEHDPRAEHDKFTSYDILECELEGVLGVVAERREQ